jgi:hypothetical protein
MAFFFKSDIQTPNLPYTNIQSPTLLYTNTQTPSILYTNGDKYFGQTYRTYTGYPLAHGYGTMYKANGDTYTGNYSEGRRHGYGQFYSASIKRQYIGGFRYDEEEGYATIICPVAHGGQRCYVGDVRKGKRHGQGRQSETSASGCVTQFEGQWVDDQLQGPGKYTKTECNTTTCCEGTFINGRLEGWGTYSSSSYGSKKSAFFQGGLVVRWGC